MIDRIIAGRYKIVAPIGEGGMSRVWRAQDLNTGKVVAVKVLREEFRDDATFVRRFEHEAQAAARMTHPNIANLLDVGVEADGTRYLVIEYVSGKTLKQFIQESGAIRPETAAHIIIRVLAAMQHAHQNGVIHRDIKPQNILIDREGTVKVSDFGIARLANAQTENQSSETVMGSVYYFSPEQAKGAAVDEKSDLYSVGVVFYEMLTGRVPFAGDTPVAIAMKHIQELPKPPSELNPAVSPALDFVVLHAMEKRPRHRYASATDMLRDVRLAMEHPDTILAARAEADRRERDARAEQRHKQATQKRVKWMRRLLVGLFSLILLGLMALAGYVIMEQILVTRNNQVEVPNVIGLHKDSAIQTLVTAGIDPYVISQPFDYITEDIVADQSILPGTFVQRGEVITITVCQSTYDILMPNLVGMPYTDAVTLISSLGIVPGRIERQVSSAELGVVLSQSIEYGSYANKGDTIDLVLSGGTVTVPQLVDLTQEQAVQTIVALQLQLGGIVETPVSDPDMVGKVVGQTPPAYKQIMRNSTIEIEIGVPATTLYKGEVTLNLDNMQPNTVVSIRVPNEDGTETVRYSQKFAEEPTKEVVVALYSPRGGDGTYDVYFDDEVQYTGIVTYSR